MSIENKDPSSKKPDTSGKNEAKKGENFWSKLANEATDLGKKAWKKGEELYKKGEKIIEEAKKKSPEKEKKSELNEFNKSHADYQHKKSLLERAKQKDASVKSGLEGYREAEDVLSDIDGAGDFGPKTDTSIVLRDDVEKSEKEVEEAKKNYIESVKKKQKEAESLLEKDNSVGGLDSETRKSAQGALSREYIKNTLQVSKLSEETQKKAIEQAKSIHPEFDFLSQEERADLLKNTPIIRENIQKFVDEYNKSRTEESPNLQPGEIEFLARENLGYEDFDMEKDFQNLSIPDPDTILENTDYVDAAMRGIAEHHLDDLHTILGENMTWDNMPDELKTRILHDENLSSDINKLPERFREEIGIAKSKQFDPRGPDETTENYAKRIAKASGMTVNRMENIARNPNGYNLSPFMRLLANIFSGLGVMFEDSGMIKGSFWRDYARNNSQEIQITNEEYGSGNADVPGTLPGYGLEIDGEITESEKQTIQTISESFKGKVDENMHQKLLSVLERHAKNNPNFRADQPFVGHDISTKQAFVFIPGEGGIICPATHGYAGVGNISGKGGTSLGSKTLSPGWSDETMKYRVIVDGLESCNKNDKDRLIRIHEWRGAGTRTEGCTGLETSVAQKVFEAVKRCGGGAQETFQSNSVGSSQKPSDSPEFSTEGLTGAPQKIIEEAPATAEK